MSESSSSSILRHTAHRPWPLPSRSWAIAMSWHDLLFAHWPVPATALQALLPQGLQLDTFDGQAWLGVVPFHMTGIRPRFSLPLPGVSAFPELNVRTYVTAEGKPGVWFFSLDATSRLAVRGARWLYHLPYHDARIECRELDGWVHYRARRTHRGSPPAEFRARYRPTSPVRTAEPGSLEHWLVERYCLYAHDPRRGELFRGDIQHAPWPLQSAEAELECCEMTAGLNVSLTGPPPHLHFARRIDTVAWRLERVART